LIFEELFVTSAILSLKPKLDLAAGAKPIRGSFEADFAN
jgi:hypothetical protein